MQHRSLSLPSEADAATELPHMAAMDLGCLSQTMIPVEFDLTSCLPNAGSDASMHFLAWIRFGLSDLGPRALYTRRVTTPGLPRDLACEVRRRHNTISEDPAQPHLGSFAGETQLVLAFLLDGGAEGHIDVEGLYLHLALPCVREFI
jgi:hypothetical protein